MTGHTHPASNRALVLAHIFTYGGSTSRSIEASTDLDPIQISNALASLKAAGFVTSSNITWGEMEKAAGNNTTTYFNITKAGKARVMREQS